MWQAQRQVAFITTMTHLTNKLSHFKETIGRWSLVFIWSIQIIFSFFIYINRRFFHPQANERKQFGRSKEIIIPSLADKGLESRDIKRSGSKQNNGEFESNFDCIVLYSISSWNRLDDFNFKNTSILKVLEPISIIVSIKILNFKCI